MTSPPLRIWCVSDGRSGIERQTIAVSNALSELIDVEMRVVQLNPAGPQTWLPPQFWPMPLVALPAAQRAILGPPWPDVWIANGRRSIPYSLRAKAWSGGKTLVVQLQDPRVDPKRFDLVVPPRHDGVKGDNVIETLGAPVWFTKAQIEAAKHLVAGSLLSGRRAVLVILGGSSKRHTFTSARAEAILASLNEIALRGYQLLITTSRRTPADIADRFRSAADRWGAQFFETESRDGPNPYLGWLASSQFALVTEDSTNMMTDAAFFGLPIHLVKLEGGDARFDRLHQGFLHAGAARWFNGELESWTYPPMRDAMAVADAIVSRLTNATT